MANGEKTGGRDFQPGQSGNPNGRPRLPEDLKAARRLNKVELDRILNEYLHMSLNEIKERASNPDTPALEVMVAKVVAEAIKRGDEKRLGFILDRLVGPVKTKVALEGGGDDTPPIKMDMSEAKLIEVIRIARGEAK